MHLYLLASPCPRLEQARYFAGKIFPSCSCFVYLLTDGCTWPKRRYCIACTADRWWPYIKLVHIRPLSGAHVSSLNTYLSHYIQLFSTLSTPFMVATTTTTTTRTMMMMMARMQLTRSVRSVADGELWLKTRSKCRTLRSSSLQSGRQCRGWNRWQLVAEVTGVESTTQTYCWDAARNWYTTTVLQRLICRSSSLYLYITEVTLMGRETV